MGFVGFGSFARGVSRVLCAIFGGPAVVGIAAGAVLAGCYQPTFPEALPCSESRRCPAGQTCRNDQCVRPEDLPDDAAPDAAEDAVLPSVDAGPDGPPGDRDRDGVLDPDDNCPDDPNSGQNDEDDDGVGNVCDNCPHRANPKQENMLDRPVPDGVGDACDPNPSVSGDTIAFFDAFDTLDPARWQSMGGSVEAKDGRVYVTPSAAGGVGDLILREPIDAFSIVVRARGTDTVGTEIRGFGAWVGASGTVPPTGFLCEHSTPLPDIATHTRVRLVEVSAGRTVLKESEALAFGTFQLTVLRNLSNPKALCCFLSGAGGGGSDDPNACGDVTLGPGRVGLRAVGLPTRFDWIVVFGRSP